MKAWVALRLLGANRLTHTLTPFTGGHLRFGVVLTARTVVESEEERYVGSMLLEPRSLFLMTDEAYVNMLHGIKEVKEDFIDEKVFNGKQASSYPMGAEEFRMELKRLLRVPVSLAIHLFLSSRCWLPYLSYSNC
ncbi:unnamed protein product [Haemonchus placei]|uniref:2OG-FeII_Oxy_2 domain-containing protein n=1 Tax=Haemonchus placei TaxID=6290 RepID=A0A0N4WH51_HAEPC|nr:unnamed protein product [Haemonchus placei]